MGQQGFLQAGGASTAGHTGNGEFYGHGISPLLMCRQPKADARGKVKS